MIEPTQGVSNPLLSLRLQSTTDKPAVGTSLLLLHGQSGSDALSGNALDADQLFPALLREHQGVTQPEVDSATEPGVPVHTVSSGQPLPVAISPGGDGLPPVMMLSPASANVMTPAPALGTDVNARDAARPAQLIAEALAPTTARALRTDEPVQRERAVADPLLPPAPAQAVQPRSLPSSVRWMDAMRSVPDAGHAGSGPTAIQTRGTPVQSTAVPPTPPGALPTAATESIAAAPGVTPASMLENLPRNGLVTSHTTANAALVSHGASRPDGGLELASQSVAVPASSQRAGVVVDTTPHDANRTAPVTAAGPHIEHGLSATAPTPTAPIAATTATLRGHPTVPQDQPLPLAARSDTGSSHSDLDVREVEPGRTGRPGSLELKPDALKLESAPQESHRSNPAVLERTHVEIARPAESTPVQPGVERDAGLRAATPLPTQTAPVRVVVGDASGLPQQLGQVIAQGSSTGSRIQIALYPQELGRLDVTFHGSPEQLTVTLTASTPQTRDLLEAHADRIRLSLQELGVPDPKVSVSSGDNTSSGRRNGQETAGHMPSHAQPRSTPLESSTDTWTQAPPGATGTRLVDAYA